MKDNRHVYNSKYPALSHKIRHFRMFAECIFRYNCELWTTTETINDNIDPGGHRLHDEALSIDNSGRHALGIKYLSLSLFLFVRGDMLLATSSPPHLIVFSTLLCLLSSFSSFYPLLPSSHLSQHSPHISALASLVSSCPPHVTLPLSSVVCHPPSFLRVLLTVVCFSPVSLSSSSALLSLPLTPPFFACLPSLLLLLFVP